MAQNTESDIYHKIQGNYFGLSCYIRASTHDFAHTNLYAIGVRCAVYL